MPAFSYYVLSQLQANVRTLWYERRKLGRLNLTHEEYIQTFVPAEARQLFRDTAMYAKNSAQWERLLWGGVSVNLIMDNKPGRPAPPVPRDLFVQQDAPEEVTQRINAWIENGGDVSRDFGRVQQLLTKLNEACSKTTMRYYWPSIIPICSMHKDTEGFAQELQQLKTPKSPPALPHGLLRACRLTSETIATAKLIPEDARMPELGEVTLEVAAGGEYSEPDLGTFYGLA